MIFSFIFLSTGTKFSLLETKFHELLDYCETSLYIRRTLGSSTE